jgi:membrane protease YdiL (CAAX protease family)
VPEQGAVQHTESDPHAEPRFHWHPFEAFVSPARAGRRQLWLVAIGIVSVYMATMLGGLVLELAVRFFPAFFTASPEALLFTFLVRSLGAISFGWLALIFIAPRLHQRSFISLFGEAGRFWRGFTAGALLCVLLVVFAEAALLAYRGGAFWTPVPQMEYWWWFAASVIVLVCLQASVEEVVFRGYLLQQLAARFRSPILWAVAPSLFFGAIHYAPNTFASADSVNLARLWVISAALFGLFATYLTWRTGSVGMAVGFHIVNNWFALLVLDQLGSRLERLALFKGPGLGAVEMVGMFAIYIAVTLYWLERPQSWLRRWLQV